MTREPRVSVVIPTYNRRERIIALLDELGRQSFPMSDAEVVVIDDGSTDGSAEALRTFAPANPFALTVLERSHGGPGSARNAGVAGARAPVIAFLEDDVVPDRAWLKNGLARFDDPSVDGVEGMTVSGETSRSLRMFDPGDFLSFIPCNLFLRRHVLLECGGYDEEFFDPGTRLYFREDIELGFRLRSRGARVVREDGAVVSHPRQFSRPGDVFRHLRRYFFDPLLYKKHPREYREQVERKRVGPFTIGRPFHKLSALYIVSLVTAVILYQGGFRPAPFLVFPVLMFLCVAGMRMRYRDLPASLTGSILFFVAPFYYYYWLIRGCRHFKSWNVLL